MALEHSRPLLLAATATGTPQSVLERRLEDSLVVVSLDPGLPLAPLTARVLLTTLRRTPGRLALDLDGLPGSEAERLEAAVNEVDSDRPLYVGGLADDRAVRIHVGTSAPRGVTRIVPEGYGAHVAAAASSVIRPARPGNALGAVTTAAFGATEAFKHTAGVRPARRVIHRHLKFCPITLTGDLSFAPGLPGWLTLHLALLGVGAIGTGIALILSAGSRTHHCRRGRLHAIGALHLPAGRLSVGRPTAGRRARRPAEWELRPVRRPHRPAKCVRPPHGAQPGMLLLDARSDDLRHPRASNVALSAGARDRPPHLR